MDQENRERIPTAGTARDMPTPTDAQIAAFAAAYAKVQEIDEKFSSRIEAADTVDQARQAQQKAASAASRIIEEAGLTAGEYSLIAQAARNDAELERKVKEHLENDQ